MNQRLAPLAIGAATLAGLAVAVLPQHAASILRLLVATAVGCALVLAVVELLADDLRSTAVPRRPSPLDRPPSPPVRPMEPPGLAAARRALAQDASPGPLPLSAAAWERVAVRSAAAFAGRGIDLEDPTTSETARRSVSPAVWDAITHRPSPPVRGGTAAAPHEVAAAVDRILDELDRIS